MGEIWVWYQNDKKWQLSTSLHKTSLGRENKGLTQHVLMHSWTWPLFFAYTKSCFPHALADVFPLKKYPLTTFCKFFFVVTHRFYCEYKCVYIFVASVYIYMPSQSWLMKLFSWNQIRLIFGDDWRINFVIFRRKMYVLATR